MINRTNKAQPTGLSAANVEADIERIAALHVDELRAEWCKIFGTMPPAGFTKHLLARALTYRIQERSFGGLSARTERLLRDLSKGHTEPSRQIKVGSMIVREHLGILHEVMVVPGGFHWQSRTFSNLSKIAKEITGTSWNGPRFFGLRSKRERSPMPKAHAGGNEEAARLAQVGRRSSISAAKSSELAPGPHSIGASP